MTKFRKITKKRSEKLLIESFIKQFKNSLNKKKKFKKRFSFVLTGGSSPINLYKKLSRSNIDWRCVDFFWGDERFVSSKSKFSNFNLAKKHLLKNININKNQIFNINTHKKDSISSTFDYNDKIKKYFKNKKIIFDLVLLGMGTDGHIASIFPNKINFDNKKFHLIIRKDFERISISLKTINNSKKICLWLNSAKKTKIFNDLKKSKKLIPAYFLNKNKTSIYTISK